MSERITTPTEESKSTNPEALSSDDVIDTLAERRSTLLEQKAALENEPGFKRDAIELLNYKRESKRIDDELNSFNEEYAAIGGDELDAAQAAVDALNFKSTAEDHIFAKARLRDAKASLYQNFIDSQQSGDETITATEDESAPEDKETRFIVSSDGETTDLTDEEVGETTEKELPAAFEEMRDNLAAAEAQNQKELNEERRKIKITTSKGEATVTDADGNALPDDIEVNIERASDKNESSKSEVVAKAVDEAIEDQDAKDALEHPIQYKLGRGIYNIRQFAKSPLAFLSSRLATSRNEYAEYSYGDGENTRKKRLARGIGAVAVVAGATGMAYFAAHHGFHFGGGSEVAAAASPEPTAIPEAAGTHANTAGDIAGHLNNETAPTVTIDKGEGWYSVFKELGIKQSDWHDTLQEVGPRLEADHLAYWDKAHSEWRISEDYGKIPAQVAEYIKAAAK